MILRRLLAVAGVLLLLHLGVTLARARTDAGSSRVGSSTLAPAILPAAEGHVRELAIQFNQLDADDFLPVFREIFQALTADTIVRVVVAGAEDQAVFEAARRSWFPGNAGPAVRYAIAGRPITSWMRDRLAVCGNADGVSALLAPLTAHEGPEGRVHDWMVPWTLRGAMGDSATITRSSLRFDGGDLIADRKRCFIASPLLGRNPDAEPATLIKRLEQEIGRPVVRIGTTGPVPNHHIGMFITPLGNGRVAVGDPDLALPHAGGVEGADTDDLRLERFRRVARELAAAGLEIVRIPLLPKQADFVFVSYNNVLCDQREDGLHVIMPVYGLTALDAAATAAWEAAGATVHPIDCRAIYTLGGSVRCLVAPLVRE